MNRSTGVTAIAVVEIIGGGLIGLFGVFAAVGIFFLRTLPQTAGTPPMPGFLTTIVVAECVLFLGFCAWAIASAIGLLNLKNWARISTCVIGGLMAAFSLFGVIFSWLMANVPPPTPPGQEVPPGFMTGFMAVMAVCWLIVMAIGIWWLVALNRKIVKAQFIGTGSQGIANANLPTAGVRPLSITIIAWWMIIEFGLPLPIYLFSPYPIMLFGVAIHGWTAKLTYSLVCLVGVLIGIGLLRLNPQSILLAVAYHCFWILNFAITFLLPGSFARFERVMRESVPPDDLWILSSMEYSKYTLWVGVAFSLLTSFLCLWFLITRRKAFLEAAAAKAASPAT